jgi:hypothetical protein
MTPIKRSTRHNIKDGHLSEQHYLHRYGGQMVVGYFPWNGKVIVVGFDGSRTDALERIRENSVCELLTVEEARRHWKGRISSCYTPAAPREWENILNRGVVYGLACDFRNAQESDPAEQMKSVYEMLDDLLDFKHKPAINRTHKSKYEDYDNSTTYALKA